MSLPPKFIEILTKILHGGANTLEGKLKELALKQKSLNPNHGTFLLPSEIIKDLQHLTLEINGRNSRVSKIISTLLGEWQAKRITKQIGDLNSNLDRMVIPSNFSRKISERILLGSLTKQRLLILAAPFKTSSSCITGLKEDLEIELNEDLKSFLNSNYPSDNEECSVEFYSNYFYNPINDDDIYQLQSLLTNIPTLVLHNSISDYKAYFHLSFWLPYSNYILTYTLPVWHWEDSCEALEISGKNKQESLRVIRQTIILIQEILATFITDWYYLHLIPNYSPRLLQSITILPFEDCRNNLIKPYIEIITTIQNQQQNTNLDILKIISNQQIDTNKRLKQRIKEWSLSKTITSHSGSVHSLAFNSDRSILMSGGSDSILRLWHPNTGKESLNLKGHQGDIFAVKVSNNDRYFASSGSDCKVLIWSLDKLQEPSLFKEHTAYVSSLDFCPDSRLLASGSYDNTIRIFDLWSGKVSRTFSEHSSYVTSIAFNAKGDLLASGSYDRSIRIWNPWESESRLTLMAHSDYVNSIKFSPVNNLLASGSRDRTIRLWRPETGTMLAVLKGHTGSINSLAFSPNGEILVSGSSDRTVRLWNPITAEELGILHVGEHPILCVHFSKDGKQLAVGSSWTDNIKIWNCS